MGTELGFEGREADKGAFAERPFFLTSKVQVGKDEES
jgi:hypothetical protein